MLETVLQWVVFIVSSFIYLVGAIFNGMAGWRTWIKGQQEGLSPAPFLFGLIGIIAVLSTPFGVLVERIKFLWIPFVFDYGSGPYLLMVVYYLVIKKQG